MIVNGKQLEVTPAIKSYAEKKVQTLEKFYERIVRATVTVGMETHHHLKGEIFFAECKLEVPGGDIFAKQTAKDVYAALDLLKDELEAEVKKFKVHQKGNQKKNKIIGRDSKEYKVETEV